MSGRRLKRDLSSIGARLEAERKSLGLTQDAAADMCGYRGRTWSGWEANTSFPPADALVSFSAAGADVLFILTGRRELGEPTTPQAYAGVTVRRAMAKLPPLLRRRLLLDLLAEEVL